MQRRVALVSIFLIGAALFTLLSGDLPRSDPAPERRAITAYSLPSTSVNEEDDKALSSQPEKRGTSVVRPVAIPGRTIAIDPPVFAYRDPLEWQGALVNESLQIPCVGSQTCGLALACIEGICSPCRADSDCVSGERCAVQHCILSENHACTTRRDCGTNELCELSGLSPGPRGNASTTSYCSKGEGGTEVEVQAIRRGSRTEPSDSAERRTSRRAEELLRARGAR